MVFLLLWTVFLLPSCKKPPETDPEIVQTVMSVDTYLDRRDAQWFLTGKKEYALQAKMVSKETSFRNHLEMADYTVNDDGMTVILKGSIGEQWTSKLPDVLSTHKKPDGSALSAADFAEKDQWIDIITQSEPNSYYAMHVPLEISVTLETAEGDELHTNLPNAPHGNGDYLVCRIGTDGQPDLADVWVLNGVVFPEYYDVSP